ncbi:14-3-3-like protein A [Artemisia annua]|uniref:14-3-3-like protein A n=1 Tax=Artemisia annua TaxID=35608 RepID=A0A2U1LPD0_ARTAN|nr:14-3-3-like protein A [Artemisia annua]
MEKLSEEVKLFEDMVKFMEKISVSNEKVTMDDREVLSVARNNVNGVQCELCTVISSSSTAIDVSLIVSDYRSKVEKELINICNKVSNITIKVDVKDYVDSFQHDEIDTYFKKRKKLTLESEDYEQTLEFMDKLMVIARKEQVSEKDLSILIRAYNMIMTVYRALSDTLDSDQSSSVWDIDVSLTINESRSKVEKELSYICNNMTNHTIKEAVSRHLDSFKAGHLPKKLLPRVNYLTSNSITIGKEFHVFCTLSICIYNFFSPDMKTTNKKSKLGSGNGEFRSDAEVDFGYHDHSKRIKKDHRKRIKEQEDLYSQINASFRDFYHEHVGKGNEIPHAYTADDISEDDFFGDWEPELMGKGIDVPNVYTVDDSSEDEYDSCTEMSDGIFSF